MRPRLFPFELAWTHAAFDAIHPEGTALGLGVRSMYPARFLDDTLAKLPVEQSFGIRLALWIVALAPVFTIWKLGTIASIAAADRVRVLERLLASKIYAVRQLTLSFKTMAALLYSQSMEVRARMLPPRGGTRRLVPLRTKTEAGDASGPARERAREGGSHEHAA